MISYSHILQYPNFSGYAVFCYNPHETSLHVPATLLHEIQDTHMSRTRMISYSHILRISEFFWGNAAFCYNPH